MGTNWDDEDDESPAPAVVVKKKFDDDEDDVVDSWDAADDSEEEAVKASKKAEAESKRLAELAASKKSKSERIKEHQSTALSKRAELEAQLAALDADEDPAEKRERLRNLEIESDLASFEDLLANPGDGRASARKAATGTLVTTKTTDGEEIPIDLSTLSVFRPAGKAGFDEMKEKLVPLFGNQMKKPHYPIFLAEFYRECAKGMTSEGIKKLASSLTALANEKMKEEKTADKKGGKKKAAGKATISLGAGAAAGKAGGLDTTNYADDYDGAGDDYDDFM